MMQNVIIFLSSMLLFLVGNATPALKNRIIESIISDDIGLTVSLSNHTKNSVLKQRIKFNPVTANITVVDIPSDVWFIVLQVHTFQYNITISYNKTMLDRVSNKSLFGSNIGLYFKTHNITTIQAFLKNDNVYSVDMLVVIVTYGRNAPIPGGCNMEFDIETAPYQKLDIKNEMIIVDIQPASVLAVPNAPSFCNKTLEYKMYRLYLPGQDLTPETYFEAIASMLTVQDITQNGNEIPSALTGPMRRIYSAYAGTGSVYAAIVTYENHFSAYIPIFTYACSPLLYPESCQVLNDTFTTVVCTLVLIVGFGYYTVLLYNSILRKTTIEDKLVFIDGLLCCMMSGIFGYILAVATGNYSTGINILIGLSTAILGTILSIMLNVCELSSSKLSLGLLCACITYLYAPAWMFYILESDWLFWPMFVILTIAITILARLIPNAFINAIFVSFFVIIAIDYYAKSNLKYIIITLIRRITITRFRLAVVYPPHQYADSILIITWFALIALRWIPFCACTTDREPSETKSLLSNSHYGNYSSRKMNFAKPRRYYRRRN